MANRTIQLTDELHAYLLNASVREPKVLSDLRRETAKLDMSIMQIAPEQGQFMSMLIKLTGARRAIEIGVFTGYSTLCMALPMPADSKIIACDISREWTDMAQQYWRQAGQSNKIDLHIGPAIETLTNMIENGHANTFDFAFIDADKPNYCNYYESCLQLVRPGGLIAIDNVLWGGSVIDAHDNSEDTIAIRKLNKLLQDDQRVDISMVPIGDGLTLARLKEI